MSNPSAIAAVGFPDEQQHHHHHPEDHGLLLPDLNGVDLVMSLSPKSNINRQPSNQATNAHGDNLSTQPPTLDYDAQHHHLQQQHQQNPHYHHLHSTPFSVTDILSPIEESYRKLELAANPPSPYR